MIRSKRGTYKAASGSDQQEKNLWIGVIDQAISDATRPYRNNETIVRQAEREEARRWFWQGDQDFQNACELAGFEPSAVRERVLRMLARLGSN